MRTQNGAIRPLPQLAPPYVQSESVLERGARALQFILNTSCTATLCDLDLERADTAAVYAVAGRETSAIARERISDVRHAIARALTYRRSVLPEAGNVPMPTPINELPNLGPMAPLRPVQPRFPSAPAVRKPEIAF